jgi:polar amino acid transport system substrate-binding protein
LEAVGGWLQSHRRALGASWADAPGTVRYLAKVVEDLKASGFIAGALRRSGQDAARVAPSGPAKAAGVRPAGTG